MTALAERVRRRLRYRRARRRGTIGFPSDLLDWMELSTAGMLHRGQRHLLDLAVRNLPSNDPVVEIGAFCGLSANVITYFLRLHERPNRLVSVDPWVFEGEDATTVAESSIPFTAYRELVVEQYVRNVRFWSADRPPSAVRLTSDAFFEAWERGGGHENVLGGAVSLGGPIALCFLDGDHEYEQARRDFLNVDRLLVPGGMILFDDSDEFGGFPHLYDVVSEAVADHGYELVAANPHHLLRKRR